MASGIGEYIYSTDQCSVEDKGLLSQYRNKRNEWIDLLESDPHHNIYSQIHSMMWNDAVYRSINEARRFSSGDVVTSATSGVIGEFIDTSYINVQVMSICRLIDKPHKDAKKNPISLRRILQDIKRHRNIITRENFVSYDGLPYDYESARASFFERLKPGEAQLGSMRGPDAWSTAESAHKAFDELSGVAAQDRSRTDLIREEVFTIIESWLNEPVLQNIGTLRDKYIGHAADEISRKIRPLDQIGLSLADISAAHRLIIRTVETIGSEIVYGTTLGNSVPHPHFDVFENLDSPFIPTERMGEMEEWWNHHAMERDRWLRERGDLISGKILPEK